MKVGELIEELKLVNSDLIAIAEGCDCEDEVGGIEITERGLVLRRQESIEKDKKFKKELRIRELLPKSNIVVRYDKNGKYYFERIPIK